MVFSRIRHSTRESGTDGFFNHVTWVVDRNNWLRTTVVLEKPPVSDVCGTLQPTFLLLYNSEVGLGGTRNRPKFNKFKSL